MKKFEQFAKEKHYLLGVSPATLEWYRHSLRWLNSEDPDEAELKSAVVRMREKGCKASACNSYIRAINSYLKWSGSHLKVPKLKEEQRVLPTFSVEDIQKISAWRPKDYCGSRLHIVMLALVDTGCRIDELLSLKWADVDFDNLLVTVSGKGSKQRKIPFSFELRKRLFRFRHDHELVFPTLKGRKLGRRDVLRDVKRLCKKLGVRAPERTLHAFRHTFAVNYLRRGGSVFHLQKALGHSSLEMTRRYANLNVEDLQKVHEKISLLA